MTNTSDRHINQLLLKIIRDKGIKQNVLAEACETSPSFLNRILHGRKNIPEPLLVKLTAALGLDDSELSQCGLISDELDSILWKEISLLDDIQKCELLKKAKMMNRFGRKEAFND